jgi:hypothetical protein
VSSRRPVAVRPAGLTRPSRSHRWTVLIFTPNRRVTSRLVNVRFISILNNTSNYQLVIPPTRALRNGATLGDVVATAVLDRLFTTVTWSTCAEELPDAREQTGGLGPAACPALPRGSAGRFLLQRVTLQGCGAIPNSVGQLYAGVDTSESSDARPNRFTRRVERYHPLRKDNHCIVYHSSNLPLMLGHHRIR